MNGYKKNAMSGAYADVGAGAKPPVAGIGFFVWRTKSEQRETGRERVLSGRRYCDGFERKAGANQPTEGLHINF